MALGQNPPAAGWSDPDKRGFITFTIHGSRGTERAPVREGYECFFVAVVGVAYTRWTYRPLTAKGR